MIDFNSLDGDNKSHFNASEAHAQTATRPQTLSQQQQQQQLNEKPTKQQSLSSNQQKPTNGQTNMIQQQSSIEIVESCSKLGLQTHQTNYDDSLLTCMLITANVGTIFEESELLELWFQQLSMYITSIEPQLVAIHCQEVGGKNYESSMKNVANFTKKFVEDSAIFGNYSRVRVFLDENFECLEQFTALGSLYLVHNSVKNVKLYNFKTAQYDVVEGNDILINLSSTQQQQNCNNVPSSNNIKCALSENVEKVKFPHEIFPECRLSRKGFMRTRWLFNDYQPLDLINIHLFHDSSNLVAMKTTPSPYAQTRQKALDYVLQQLAKPLDNTWTHCVSASGETNKHCGQNNNRESQVPLFIFGDFNFRLDTNKVIQRITEGASPVIKRSSDSNEVVEFVYHRKTSTLSGPTSDDDETTHKRHNNSNTGDMVSRIICSENSSSWGHEPTKTEQAAKACEANNDNDATECSSDVFMTVGKKLFDFENLDETFRATENTEWLQELDTELDSFRNQLYEFKVSFSPSYPFKEDASGGYSYMRSRCPAWCDRILFNVAGNKMIHSKSLDTSNMDSEKKIEWLQDHGDVIYRLMGNTVPMGDHKPVLLYCQLDLNTAQSDV